MPAYHSRLNGEKAREVGKLPIFPFKTQVKGPAPPCTPGGEALWKVDIIDEALEYFKANVLFRNFEIEGPADRLLIYVTLYINQCLSTCKGKSKADATKLLFTQALSGFALPGDAKFPLGGMVCAPDRQDAEFLRNYMIQLRQETGLRVLEKLYAKDPAVPDKWWICFSKRKFLDMSL